MSEHPKTLKVKPTSAEQGAYVVINEEDFDAEVHKKFTPAELKKIEEAEAAPEASGDDSGEQPQT